MARDPSPATGRIVGSGFRPHPLLGNAHLQTILPSRFRPLPRIAFLRERIELPDGDFVDLGWAGAAPGAPLALLVHGLTGGFESKYLRGAAQRLIAVGWRIAALQLRGGGAQPNRLPRAYHHGDTADLRFVLQLLRARHPHDVLAAVGWSLGGNVVLKYLGEEGENALPNLAFAASVPFSLRECAEHLRHGFARVYQHTLLTGLKDMVRRKQAVTPLAPPANLRGAFAARDFFEFDDAFTAPLNGFRDAEDYYARAACGQFLPRIRRPTLIVHALDDPFMPPAIVPQAAALAPRVTLELSARGGHVGFVSAGPLGQPRFWLEDRLAAWLRQVRGV